LDTPRKLVDKFAKRSRVRFAREKCRLLQVCNWYLAQ
jgi:hypothetical protein